MILRAIIGAVAFFIFCGQSQGFAQERGDFYVLSINDTTLKDFFVVDALFEEDSVTVFVPKAGLETPIRKNESCSLLVKVTREVHLSSTESIRSVRGDFYYNGSLIARKNWTWYLAEN